MEQAVGERVLSVGGMLCRRRPIAHAYLLLLLLATTAFSSSGLEVRVELGGFRLRILMFYILRLPRRRRRLL